MSVKTIFEAMALLVRQHKELNVISAEKTELIKANDTKKLAILLKKESKHIRTIEKKEKDRQDAVHQYLNSKGETKAEGTVSVLLKHLPVSYHEPLIKLQESLLQEMGNLRKKEALNRTLVEDSLHFVQMTMDMIQPDPEAVHYTHPDSSENDQHQRYSIFDSKA